MRSRLLCSVGLPTPLGARCILHLGRTRDQGEMSMVNLMTDLEGAAEPDQTIDLASLREEYSRAGLEEADLDPDPLAMFDRWMREAVEAHLYDANAMVVSTVGPDFQPSARMVLLKGVSERGFVFFTNTGSR